MNVRWSRNGNDADAVSMRYRIETMPCCLLVGGHWYVGGSQVVHARKVVIGTQTSSCCRWTTICFGLQRYFYTMLEVRFRGKVKDGREGLFFLPLSYVARKRAVSAMAKVRNRVSQSNRE